MSIYILDINQEYTKYSIKNVNMHCCARKQLYICIIK